AMQLYLVHNDPLDSLLVSADGEPLYSVHTSADSPSPADSPCAEALSRSPDSYFSPSSGRSTFSGLTSTPPSSVSIKRLERHQFSRGNVETEVGRIEYGGDDVGTRVQLCHTGIEMCAPANSNVVPSPTAPVREFTRDDDDDDDFIPDPTWSFNGPDNLPYKWLSLASCPVLVHDTQPTPTPVARYRPAKLGIVSRSRRGFLEILPRGLEMEDWIVVTFVGYFRMKLGGDIPLTRGRTSYTRHDPQASAPLPTAPMGVVGVGVGMPYAPHVPVTLSAPVSPMRSPRYLSPPKPPMSPSPLAYLESLRRKGRDYAAAKRN
ncbi:hypothetical protein P691DRAFT_673293, partial [Macrolepiota fuliginosa MF-IS2]